jgi:subtilase family serine protease
VADVSAVADPNTGVSVYDTYRESGWLIFGGTSVASPLIAGVYALAQNAASVTMTYGSYSYSHVSSLFDVAGGANGSCGGSYLCTAVTGYDGPTGNGTPNGSGAF